MRVNGAETNSAPYQTGGVRLRPAPISTQLLLRPEKLRGPGVRNCYLIVAANNRQGTLSHIDRRPYRPVANCRRRQQGNQGRSGRPLDYHIPAGQRCGQRYARAGTEKLIGSQGRISGDLRRCQRVLINTELVNIRKQTGIVDVEGLTNVIQRIRSKPIVQRVINEVDNLKRAMVGKYRTGSGDRSNQYVD